MPDRTRKTRAGPAAPAKDPIAAELGRRGGVKGGRARAERLPPELRRAIAQRAAATRWAKRRGADGPGPSPTGEVRTAAAAGALTLAGRTLQVARFEGGLRLVGQLSLETALGEALAPEVQGHAFTLPGDWQVRRGLTLATFAGVLAAAASAGNAAALGMLLACVEPSMTALIDGAAEALASGTPGRQRGTRRPPQAGGA